MFYILYVEGYDEPVQMAGPYPSYDAAIEGYYNSLIESGWEPEEGENAHSVYLHDDAVRIGRAVASPSNA